MSAKPNGSTGRPYFLEYYRGVSHRKPTKRTTVLNPTNALVCSSKHLDRGDYVKVVCGKVESGRMLWTRLRIGPHLIMQRGDLPNRPITMQLELPGVES